jgi:hypothetical protein
MATKIRKPIAAQAKAVEQTEAPAGVEWPAGKTFGELDSATRRAVTRQAAARLTAELSHPAVAAAITAALEADPADAGDPGHCAPGSGPA